MIKKYYKLIGLNILGLAIFLSWYLLDGHGFWSIIDTNIFYYFNDKLEPESAFTHFVGITNIRHFDIISFGAMLLLYGYYYCKQDDNGKRKMWLLGIVLLLSAVIINQLGHLIPVERSSPTAFFDNTNRVSKILEINAKDFSHDSFPGDHGLMLMIFAGFMLRYFGKNAFFMSCLIVAGFVLPRIMAGAHWFTDIAVGSFSIALVGVSWAVLTPLSDNMVKWLDKKIYKRKK